MAKYSRVVRFPPCAESLSWEAEAKTLRCRTVRGPAEALGFPLERWWEDAHFLSETLFAQDRERFLASCQAAACGCPSVERYRVRGATAAPRVFQLTLAAVQRRGAVWLLGQMVGGRGSWCSPRLLRGARDVRRLGRISSLAWIRSCATATSPPPVIGSWASPRPSTWEGRTRSWECLRGSSGSGTRGSSGCSGGGRSTTWSSATSSGERPAVPARTVSVPAIPSSTRKARCAPCCPWGMRTPPRSSAAARPGRRGRTRPR